MILIFALLVGCGSNFNGSFRGTLDGSVDCGSGEMALDTTSASVTLTDLGSTVIISNLCDDGLDVTATVSGKALLLPAVRDCWVDEADNATISLEKGNAWALFGDSLTILVGGPVNIEGSGSCDYLAYGDFYR